MHRDARLPDHRAGPAGAGRPGRGPGLPRLLGAPASAADVDRLETLEEWTRNLAGVLAVGVSLEQAIQAGLRSTPEPIRPQVQTLVARLATPWQTEVTQPRLRLHRQQRPQPHQPLRRRILRVAKGSLDAGEAIRSGADVSDALANASDRDIGGLFGDVAGAAAGVLAATGCEEV